ncbi:MAG TPA: N-acetylmuramic acid 6-phosphate etherase [Patescibacteria group bacterium]|nr:N-acetylmuramic acid 6-phosphate etherase [Patescibacteria group bacterium]
MPNTLPTERPNRRTRGLDRQSTLDILRILNREDSRVPAAVARAIPAVARAVERVVRGWRLGGRLIYVGAGTSGRLGALDAAECPPTFAVPAGRVRAVIAGGRRALDWAVEGAEDSAPQGARDLGKLRVGPQDVIVGLTASGSTPYVAGALASARRRRATTVLVTTNPRPPIRKLADIAIVADVGPEAVAGSTRMKSGTAQKLLLNMLTTAAMARLGRVYDNQMVYVALTNRKLRRRGRQLLVEAAGVNPAQAKRALARAGGDLPTALVMLKAGVGKAEAQRRLRLMRGHVRRAIEIDEKRPPAH